MAPSLPAPVVRLFRSRRLRLSLAWLVGLFGVFLLVGFFILPPVAKAVLEKQLGNALHRQATIERLEVNPLKWTVDVGGLSIRAAAGDEVLGFDGLHLDVQAASLLKGGLVIREVVLAGPRLKITRLTPERYDISDLIDEWSKPSDSPSDSPPPRFAVSNIQVTGGQAVLVDKPKGATHTISDLALSIPFLSSLPYQADVFVEPHFAAKINGAPLVLTGRSKPFADSHESELSLDLDRVALAQYLPYSPVKLPFALKGGSVDSELKLVFRQNVQGPATVKLVGQVHLKDLALQESGGQPLLAWKQLDVALQEADLVQQHFLVESVRVAGLEAQTRREADGKLNWATLADRLGGGGSGRSQGKSAPVIWSVGEIRLEDAALRYQDLGLPGQPVQVIDHLDAKVAGLSSAPDSKLAISLAARANGSGSLKVAGEVRLQPVAANLDVETGSLPLLALQPYFAERLNLTLVRGRLSGRGNLDLRMEEKGLAGGFKGQLTVGDLHSVDKANRADFLKWKSLFVGDIDVRLSPLAVTVGQVALSDFYARVILSPQARLNLADIVVRPPEQTEKAEKAAEAQPQEPTPVRIGKVSLQGGTVNFSDYFVKPNYTVNVTRIAGRVTGLAPSTIAEMELKGNYGNAAPVEVLAKLNPFAAKAYLDLKGEIRGVDLTTLSTYSGKYAGYAIEKGKLSLYVTYHLDHNQLSADNRVFLDQLTFGDRVDSPDATSLPVKLGLALLKNRNGEIDVNLPISGSIDDPQFSLGGVIVRVIVNLFVKAVTSPFALLGSMFGGGEELSTVDFAPGRAGLEADTVKKLEALAKAMTERPELKLEITGRAHPEADRDGLKRAALEQAVLAEKLKDARKGADAAAEGVQVSAQEYPIYLKRAYKEAKFPKPRNVVGLYKDLPVEEMEKLMLANVPAGEEELKQLATRRAEMVQAWLAEQGKVPMERLFLLAPKVGADDKKDHPSRVDFSLR